MKLIGTLLNLVLLSGSTLLLTFLVLSGSVNHFPFDTFYWVRGDTSAITDAYNESAWTFWGVCDYNDFSTCQSGPAYPISPVDNFGTTSGVPSDFVDNRDTFFYLSRFGFAFFLLALAFSGFALLTCFLGFCFSFIDKVMVVLAMIALFFVCGAAAFQTAVVVLARNAFANDDLLSLLGVKLLAMTWAAVACLLLVFFITCSSNIANSYRKHIERINEQNVYPNDDYAPEARNSQSALGDDSSFTRANVPEKNDAESGGIRFFRIKRNQKPSDDESV